MTREEILAGDESKNVEYKVRRPEKSIKYMKSVVAFTNGKGGCYYKCDFGSQVSSGDFKR